MDAYYQRLLRSYSRIAHDVHLCNCCFENIYPGEPYHGDVWVMGEYLVVLKKHDVCPEDPWREEWERGEDNEAEYVGYSEPLPKAA